MIRLAHVAVVELGCAVDLSAKTVRELLALWVEVMDELTSRGVVRTQNNPTADLAERIACDALGLTMADKNAKGHDAVDSSGYLYQIKGRRLSRGATRKPLGVVRDLDEGQFQHLVVVLFDYDFSINLACVIPYDAFCGIARAVKRLNGHRITAGPGLLDVPGVRDVTEAARRALTALE